MKRKYYFAEKVAGKWVRQPGPALEKQQAVGYYQDRLLCGTFSGKTVGLRLELPPNKSTQDRYDMERERRVEQMIHGCGE